MTHSDPQKLTPHVQILVYNSAFESQGNHHLCISDVVAGYIAQNQGEALDTTPDGGNFDANQWQQQAFTSIDPNIELVRFMEDGRAYFGAAAAGMVGGKAVLTLKPREVRVHSVIDYHKPNDPTGDAAFDIFKWRGYKGDSWECVMPNRQPLQTRISHGRQNPDETIIAATVQSLKADQGLRGYIGFEGIAHLQKTAAGFRAIWGSGVYSICWRQYNKPTIDHRVNNDWQLLKRLDEADFCGFGQAGYEDVPFEVRRIDNRMVVTLGANSWWIAESLPAYVGSSSTELRPAHWPRGKIEIHSWGANITFGLSLLSQLDSKEKQIPGSFGRSIPRAIRRTPGTETVNGYAGGYQYGTALVKVEATANAQTVDYTCTLTPDVEGVNAPCVAVVMVNFEGSTTQNTPAFIDLRPYASSLRYIGTEPGLQASTEVQITIDRARLTKDIPNWTDYVTPFAPLRVNTIEKWLHLGTGTDYRPGPLTSPIPTTPGITADEPENLFDGYITNPDKDLEGFGDYSMMVVGRDKMLRAQEPSGYVGNQYAPADLLFAMNNGNPIYGGDYIKYTIKVGISEDEANRINGNGDPLAFFPENHYPLFSMQNDNVGYFPAIKLLMQGSFQLAPNFGGWLIDLWYQVCDIDRAVIYYGLSPLSTDGKRSYIYGRWPEIIRAWGNTLKVIPDCYYQAGDDNFALNRLNVKYRYDKSFNTVVAWGPRLGGIAGQVTPSLFQGYSRLPADDPRAEEKSWPRTLPVQQDFLGQGEGLAQVEADAIMSQLEGVEPRDLSIHIPRGDLSIHVGMKVQPKLQKPRSDTSLGVNGEEFRVKRAEHYWDFLVDEQTTDINARPISPVSGY